MGRAERRRQFGTPPAASPPPAAAAAGGPSCSSAVGFGAASRVAPPLDRGAWRNGGPPLATAAERTHTRWLPPGVRCLRDVPSCTIQIVFIDHSCWSQTSSWSRCKDVTYTRRPASQNSEFNQTLGMLRPNQRVKCYSVCDVRQTTQLTDWLNFNDKNRKRDPTKTQTPAKTSDITSASRLPPASEP